MKLLEGMKVLDITQFIAGSRCTQIMADMGAEVIKVEPPQGDTLRLIFSMISGAERNYSVFNRNKKGIALDWRRPEGAKIVRELAARSDVFVHNLVPGAMERSGLGYDDIRALRPDVIYLAISGFGSDGPRPDRAAFDIIAQASGGLFWNDQDSFRLPSNYWGDLVTGSYAATAILMAVIHRMKTGRGQFIDISMQDVMYANNYRAMMDKALEPVVNDVVRNIGRSPRDVLNSADRMPFYGFFKTRDGKVAIVTLTPRQWRDLAAVIGRPELADDPRFRNIVVQIRNHEEAVAIIDAWTSQRASAEIVELLEQKKIPCGVAHSADTILHDANLERRGMFMKVRHSEFGDIDVPGFPFKFSELEPQITAPAPGLGEHSRSILESLGYGESAIDDLVKSGVVLEKQP